ncbi:TPA: hypothetical protein ACH3X2_004724 [Trebouxia sp. C0005]|nr:MAG: hypothetical protein FRX49_07341 [Trebouxia sp. A1-2]
MQADTIKSLREEMQMAEADSKAGKHLKGRSVWVNPNWTKMQAQEQFRLGQQRCEAISHNVKACLKPRKLMIIIRFYRSQTAASSPAPLQAGPTASRDQLPATTPAAAAEASSHQ